MHIDFMKHPILQEALYIIKTLEEAGHAAYFVGGAVRDVLLNRSVHDVDIATSALPEQTMALFPKTFATGLQHGTITVVHNKVNYEVTTFRVETGYVNYRKPEQVAFVQELKLDLSRRDFTMNAMAINSDGHVVDYFAGQQALQNKILKTVGHAEVRFEEDALRMLRAIRFATTYQLRCDELLWEAIKQQKQLLSEISMERVAQEINKMLNACASITDWRLLYESELLSYTKKPLHLQAVLSYHFSTEHPLKHVQLDKLEWLWAVTYFSAHSADQDLREDLNALVFPKKTCSYIRNCAQLLSFCMAALSAICTENDNASNAFVDQYRALIGSDYSFLKKIAEQYVQLVSMTDVKWIISVYWLEHVQAHLEMSLNAVEPLLLTCGYNDVITILRDIEAKQKITKLTDLNINGKQLAKCLNREAGAWLKHVLQMLYLAVNLHIVDNEPTQLVRLSEIILDNGGI